MEFVNRTNQQVSREFQRHSHNIKEHFWRDSGKLHNNPGLRDFLGGAGIGLCLTAMLGRKFFNISERTYWMACGAGMGLFTSYSTGQDGYAYLVAIAALSVFGLKAIEAVNKGHLYVKLDPADLARLDLHIQGK